MQDEKTEQARKLMHEFAEQTGLSSSAHPSRRYLWTDAYAACNLLELHRQTNDILYFDLALHLIEQVHWELGRFRADNPRKGWISGLDDVEGSKHPTTGGLRIGKKLEERKRGEIPDARMEWDQDGQYFHYLTKWIHALLRAGETTKDATYVRWTMELADAAHTAFVYSVGDGGPKQMYWKMSTDLSYVLVASMGHHDPLDGLVTTRTLQALARKMIGEQEFSSLDRHVSDYAAICAGRNWYTDDTLGLGGLLFDAARIVRLRDSTGDFDLSILREIMASAYRGIASLLSTNALNYPAGHRLAFRELGLAIGVRCLSIEGDLKGSHARPGSKARELERLFNDLVSFLPLTEMIEEFWLNDQHQKAATWRDHCHINMVMLASKVSCLAPCWVLTRRMDRCLEGPLIPSPQAASPLSWRRTR